MSRVLSARARVIRLVRWNDRPFSWRDKGLNTRDKQTSEWVEDENSRREIGALNYCMKDAVGAFELAAAIGMLAAPGVPAAFIGRTLDLTMRWSLNNTAKSLLWIATPRARARARARPSCSTGASGPFDDRRLRSTTFRARATFKKSTSILSYSLSGVVLLFLCQFHIVLFKLCTDVL